MPLPAGVLAGLSAGTTLAKGVARAIPTAAEKENKKRLKALEGQVDKGVGLDGGEAELLQRATMDPIRSAAAGTRQRAAARAAVAGNTSGETQAQLRAEESAAVGNAAAAAGLDVAEAELAAKKANEQELEQRKMAQSRQMQDRTKDIFSTLGEAAMAGGQAVALDKVGMLDKPLQDTTQLEESLKGMGFPPEQVQFLADAARRGALGDVLRKDPQQEAMSTEEFIDSPDVNPDMQYLKYDEFEAEDALANVSGDKVPPPIVEDEGYKGLLLDEAGPFGEEYDKELKRKLILQLLTE